MKVILAALLVIALASHGFVQGNTLCPGATETQYAVVGSSDCEVPAWNYWYFEHQILLPSRDPTRFYQMTTGDVVEMRCAPGTCFSQVDQFCVHSYEWINPCVALEGPEVQATEAPSV